VTVAPKLVPTLDQVSSFLSQTHGLFIDGRAAAANGQILALHDPAKGEPIAAASEASAADVDKAVVSADAAFRSGIWSELAPSARERILLKFADLVERDAEMLAQLETLNQGKSIHISRAVDIGGAPAFMRYIAGLTTKITGETIDVSIAGGRFTASTRREAVGVVGAIAPWNFPMLIGLWKIMPALAAGCTVVLKPSELTPLTTLRLAELATEAGLPPGVFNVVTGGGDAGRHLVTHPLVRKISFTGSTATGRHIARAAADRLIPASLELGGKNPAIFLKDVAIERAVEGALLGGFFNNGQVCAAASRLYVARELYSDFVEALGTAVDALSIGPGMDPTAAVNPLVSASHRDKVLGFIEAARSSGARVRSGGPASTSGFYVRPMVLTDAPAGSAILRDEVFGPVVTVTPFDDEEDAIELANDTRMGLTASLWTNDLGKMLAYVPQLKAGTVWVNTHNVIDPAMPFGGMGESGLGRDFGIRALDSYTDVKSVCVAH